MFGRFAFEFWGMFLRRLLAIGAVLSGLVAAAGQAWAGPVYIDLTNATPFSAVNGVSSFSTVIAGVTVTLTSHGSGSPKMTFNSGSSERQGCLDGYAGSPAHNLACDGDGIGIGADDEITEGGDEKLKITFSTPVDLRNIELLDLFNNATELEKALISLDNGVTWNQFISNNNLGGYYSTNLGGRSISRIIFKSYNDCVSDYAVARLTIYQADVPEPAAAALFLVGLAGLKSMRRRARKTLESVA
ncbi:MAG: VPLPA-CTERM sorting domain-containing protein [Rhodospirillaceae bacterium]|nr:VPLPA-CTERM sorting domain-containing protein [Rhodospirillaceae bacterium]